jgi:hypothetical protein
MATGSTVSFLKYSSSETVRIGVPIASVVQIARNPVTSVVGGNSRYYLAPHVYALIPWASSMHEVSAYLDTHSSFATPRNFFAYVIGEQGILGTILFGAFVTGIWKLRSKLRGEDGWIFARILVTALLIDLRFDSWALAPMWLSFVFLFAWGSIPRWYGFALARNAPS